MSKIYEALKKAQREGHWSEAIESTSAAGGVGPAPSNENTGVAEDITEAPAELAEHAEQGGLKDADSPLSSTVEEPSQGQMSNLPAANNVINQQDAQAWVRPEAAKDERPRRFWRHKSPLEARGPRLILNHESLSRAADQFQLLRANLESSALEKDRRVILITSSLPGEGKSLVALNLGIALARAGSHVLLVDADLRTPSLHLPFNLVPLSGLLPYLEGKVEFTGCVTPTREPRLGLIAAGGITLSAPEALARSRMRSLIESARQQQPPHIILIDAPAAAAGAEAQILSKMVDGILLVIAANRTPRAAVTRTLELIKGAPELSTVLNRFDYSYSASRQLRNDGKYKAHPDA